MLTSKPPIHLLVLAIPVGIIVLFRPTHRQWLDVATWTFFAAGLALLLIAGRLAPKSLLIDERRSERRLAILLFGFEAAISAFALMFGNYWPALGIAISAIAIAWILLWSVPQLRRRRYETSYVVRRNPEAVFAFISDGRNEPQWCSEAQSVEMLTPEPIGPGSRFRAHSLFSDGFEFVGEEEIIDFEPNHRLTTRVVSGLRPNLVEFILEPFEAGSTRITHRFDYEVSFTLAALGASFREGTARRLLMESRTIGQTRLTQVLEGSGSGERGT